MHIVILGNRKNVPKTVAHGYQLKDHAQRQEERMDLVKIKNGDVVVAGICPTYGEPLFGQVLKTQPEGHLYVRLYATVFDSHYHAFHVKCMSDIHTVVDRSRLLYYLPVSYTKTELNTPYLCVRHSIV